VTAPERLTVLGLNAEEGSPLNRRRPSGGARPQCRPGAPVRGRDVRPRRAASPSTTWRVRSRCSARWGGSYAPAGRSCARSRTASSRRKRSRGWLFSDSDAHQQIVADAIRAPGNSGRDATTVRRSTTAVLIRSVCGLGTGARARLACALVGADPHGGHRTGAEWRTERRRRVARRRADRRQRSRSPSVSTAQTRSGR
jgi:hypothetical protein